MEALNKMKYVPALIAFSAILTLAQPRPLERGQAVNSLTNPAQPPWSPDVVPRLRKPAGLRIQVFDIVPSDGVDSARWRFAMAVSQKNAALHRALDKAIHNAIESGAAAKVFWFYGVGDLLP